MRHVVLTLALLVTLAAAGCGGDDSSPPATTGGGTAAAAQQEPLTELPASLAQVAPRLVDAGYRVRQVNASEFTTGKVDLEDGPLKVSVLGHRSGADLTRSRRRLVKVQQASPQQMVLAVRGRRIYVGTVQAPRTVDRARFARIVATAEGR